MCELIEGKRPAGIFATLNDATATAHADPSAADNSFIQRSGMLTSNPNFESRGNKFLIKHYAGDVLYNVPGMTDKNKDQLSKDILNLIEGSTDPFLRTLFPDKVDHDSKKRPPTAGDKIKASANDLVTNLMQCQPHYIRTIKPNQNRSAKEYDDKAILHQIKYLGLQENIRVRRAGFAYRAEFQKMVERFYLLSPSTSYAGDYIWDGDAKSGCERILSDARISKDEWQMGVTKAFIKNPETLFYLEGERDRYWHTMATRIQRAWRAYVRRKVEAAIKIQRFWRGQKDNLVYAAKRDYGHDVLAGRKERRRFSLLGMRKFMGDYLDVNGRSPQGELLRNAAGISSSEVVSFSSRGDLLVSKLGRSSKLSPRFLIVTDKAFYIVVSAAKDGRVTTSLERKIPLVTIRGISMTNLRDDFIILNVNPCEEGDPVMTCSFKTELTCVILTEVGGNIAVNVAANIEYAKKRDKKVGIKAVKGAGTGDATYKSHTITVGQGESPTARSNPNPPRKPKVKKAPKAAPAAMAGRSQNRPQARALPGAAKPSAPPAAFGGAPAAPAAVAAPVAAAATRAVPTAVKAPVPFKAAGGGARAAPPPPPPPPPPAAAPPAPAKELYRALYNFAGQEGEMNLVKGDEVEVKEKDDNGWWMIAKDGKEGWAPSNYLKLIEQPVAPPPPPPPPAHRPVPAKPPAAAVGGGAAALAAALNGRNGGSSGVSPSSTPGSSRPTSAIGGRGPPPAIKAKPVIPPKPGAKPAGFGGKPPVPAAHKVAAPAAGGPGKVARPAAAGGQLDLAAALARRAQRIQDDSD